MISCPIKQLADFSKCTLTKEDVEFLNNSLDDRLNPVLSVLVLTLFYRGSEHGWIPNDFHENCDEKGPTITLFQIKDGDCVGGFTKESWISPEEK